MEVRSLIPDEGPIALIDAATEGQFTDIPVVATQDHELIRQWALRRRAEPATGEATESGPASTRVNDDGTGIRFNFPGVGRFRPSNGTSGSGTSTPTHWCSFTSAMSRTAR